jgi:hypothetical protein
MRTRHFKTALLLMLGIVLYQQAPAQKNQFSTQASFGLVYLPFSDWGKYYSYPNNTRHFENNNPHTVKSLAVLYAPFNHYSIGFECEIVSAQATYVLRRTGSATTTNWHFKPVLLSAVFEYSIKKFNRLTPLLQCGVSYIATEIITTKYLVVSHPYTITDYLPKIENGNGFGAHIGIGVKSTLSEHYYIFAQTRYRYAEGYEQPISNRRILTLEFTGFYFYSGLGIKL